MRYEKVNIFVRRSDNKKIRLAPRGKFRKREEAHATREKYFRNKYYRIKKSKDGLFLLYTS